ncbi:MAG: PHB depolymerase family esterase [Verrucomicrobiales bacterium]|nr:PHB depolymerase family esterase [Verrucomicrobiales bacterium]
MMLLISTGLGQSAAPTGIESRIEHGKVRRSFRIHVPSAVAESDRKVPLVICLHGGGSDAAAISKSGWTPLADRESFIAVYPEGLNGRWNDGRTVQKYIQQDAVTDDVDFIIQLLEQLIVDYPVDPSRVYLLGLSNGGFMTQRLANEHTGKFGAVAVQIASLPTAYLTGALKFSPQSPLSVLFMCGTEDLFMPYEGGKLTPNFTPKLVSSKTFDFGQDSAIPVVDAVDLWVKHNRLDSSAPHITKLPDKDPHDDCHVIHHHWKSEGSSTSVELYEIVGGGHTIPGGAQYLPERIIGRVCHDINGIEATWKFFETKKRE